MKQSYNNSLCWIFMGCTNMVSVGNITFNGGYTATNAMFYNCYNLEKVGTIRCLTTIATKDRRHGFLECFRNCYSLKKTPAFVNCWATGLDSNLFYYTFYNCSSLVDVSSINDMINENINEEVNNSRNMFNNTFYNCTSLTGGIDLLPHRK